MKKTISKYFFNIAVFTFPIQYSSINNNNSTSSEQSLVENKSITSSYKGCLSKSI